MMEMATAPVRGKRSEVTASIVGQKNVLPTAYTPSAAKATPKLVMPLARFSPTQAKMAQERRIPTGDKPSLFSIKSAQKRRLNIMTEVHKKRNLPCSEEN